MEYDDRYTPLEANDYDDSNHNHKSGLKKVQSLNRGYHKLTRNIVLNNNKKKI